MNDLIENNTPHFDYGISSSYDMLMKLLYEDKKLSEECNPYDCFNFFVTAWHLYDDWIDEDQNRPRLARQKKGRTTSEMQVLLKAFKDLTNGSKHMILRKKNYEKTPVKKTYPPIVGDWRSYFDNKPEIYIEIDNSIFSMWDLRYIVVIYFKWLFDDSIAANEFPREVQEHLQRCIIKK